MFLSYLIYIDLRTLNIRIDSYTSEGFRESLPKKYTILPLVTVEREVDNLPKQLSNHIFALETPCFNVFTTSIQLGFRPKDNPEYMNVFNNPKSPENRFKRPQDHWNKRKSQAFKKYADCARMHFSWPGARTEWPEEIYLSTFDPWSQIALRFPRQTVQETAVIMEALLEFDNKVPSTYTKQKTEPARRLPQFPLELLNHSHHWKITWELAQKPGQT